MTATFLLPSTPCCGAPVFWEEAELKLPCVAGEYALPIPPGAPESFVAAVQDLLREHNLAEHDVDTGMHFWGVYGLMEAPGAVGRHGPGFPGPVRTPVRCQCLGVPFQGVPRRQCGLAADTARQVAHLPALPRLLQDPPAPRQRHAPGAPCPAHRAPRPVQLASGT